MGPSTEQLLMARRFRSLVESLARRRTTGQADMTLICGASKFPVHKVVLEASSPYFVALFRGSFPMKATVSEQVPMDMNPETLAAILDFIYLGDVSKIKTEQELKKVAKASRIMMLNDLYQYCCNALVPFLTTENFFEILDLNQKGDTKNVKLKLLYFWITHSTKLVASDDFLNLSAENVKELLNFLRYNHSKLNVVLAGLLRWLCHSEERELFVDELFACIDARLVSKECISSLVTDPAVMKSSEKLADMVAKLRAACLIFEGRKLAIPAIIETMAHPWATTLTYFSDFRVVSVFDPLQETYSVSIEKFKCVQQFDLTNMKWGSLKTNTLFQSCGSWSYVPMCQYGHTVCMVGGILGLKGDYDLIHNEFKPAGDVVFSGGPDTKMCYFKNRLFAITSNFSEKLQTTVHGSKPGCNDWTEAHPLNYYQPIARVMASSEHIYVLGDMTESGLVIEYNSDPMEKSSEWNVIHIQKSEMDPSHFFVIDNTLHALYFGTGVVKHLAYDHETKRFSVQGVFCAEGKGQTNLMKLSHFQNHRSPFVFFAKLEDPLFVPAYMWNHATNSWSVLPPHKGQCEIPSHSYTKMVYCVKQTVVN